MDIDGIGIEVARPPIGLWETVISRLKVLSRMVDYGPNKSEQGELALQLPDGRTVTMQVTSNPNPHTDTKVTLINKDAPDRESTEYNKLKKSFLNAAMPSGQSELEHTFGMFLRKFTQFFEDRLLKRISNGGMISLRNAALDEIIASSAESKAFHEAILAQLTDIDRAAVRAEYLSKVTLSVQPSRSEHDHQDVVLTIDFPGEKTRRIERRWSYYLANGMPTKKGIETSFGEMIASGSNFGSRGD
jgi:hypothetical protein